MIYLIKFCILVYLYFLYTHCYEMKVHCYEMKGHCYEMKVHCYEMKVHCYEMKGHCYTTHSEMICMAFEDILRTAPEICLQISVPDCYKALKTTFIIQQISFFIFEKMLKGCNKLIRHHSDLVNTFESNV